jgi:hypothetical protein
MRLVLSQLPLAELDPSSVCLLKGFSMSATDDEEMQQLLADNEMLARLLEVRDAKSFLAFVHALIADRETAVRLESVQPGPPYGADAGGWENVRIETYLEACPLGRSPRTSE